MSNIPDISTNSYNTLRSMCIGDVKEVEGYTLIRTSAGCLDCVFFDEDHFTCVWSLMPKDNGRQYDPVCVGIRSTAFKTADEIIGED